MERNQTKKIRWASPHTAHTIETKEDTHLLPSSSFGHTLKRRRKSQKIAPSRERFLRGKTRWIKKLAKGIFRASPEFRRNWSKYAGVSQSSPKFVKVQSGSVERA
ncbi:unnamed protein product [Cuscuta epithymum]|uniref:Uncharacterized protein n=1 Tax=Cuscuta epithymum TaxID=186058 RepID=A0AAV0D819_9ASTE|nr:unnamed protein product [Cuscuta epithymum]